MPTRLCWKPGMMCPPREGRVWRCRLQDPDEEKRVSNTVPTLTGSAAVLMSVQGAAEVMYTPLAPLSNMSVYVLGSLSCSKGGGLNL